MYLQGALLFFVFETPTLDFLLNSAIMFKNYSFQLFMKRVPLFSVLSFVRLSSLLLTMSAASLKQRTVLKNLTVENLDSKTSLTLQWQTDACAAGVQIYLLN